jgi:2,4-dienoyl-CoA reductase-like NADH-dependent reductase (Old Yellow Enzyme family)
MARRSTPTQFAGVQPHLLTPMPLRELTLPNRIVLSPMGQHSSVDGEMDDWHLMHLGQFAASGVGCVITGAVAVSPSARITPGCLGLWSEDHIPPIARLKRFFVRHGNAKLGLQFNHCGRKGSITPWQEGAEHIPIENGGWLVEAPCAIPYAGRRPPTPLSLQRLAEVREDYARAAMLADKAGVDLLELHAAHGYLLHQFLSPLSNDRADLYGGSLENRMRYPLEIFEAVRAVWPERKPLGMRVSATDWAEGGWTMEETLEFCTALNALGCDYICASSGGTVPEQSITVEPLYQVPFSRRIRDEVGIPTMAVGLITTPEQAESVLVAGDADMIAMGRALVRNPRWPWLAVESLKGAIALPSNYHGLGPG